VQSVARRLEKGGVLSCAAVGAAAQPFLAALLRHLFPQRTIVVVTEGLKEQERLHQDVGTWLEVEGGEFKGEEPHGPTPDLQRSSCTPLFYPAWETLPHDARLPHADVISERLETLVALAGDEGRVTSDKGDQGRRKPRVVTGRGEHGPLLVTNVIALLQRTFRRDELRQRTRSLTRGERCEPLDLVEWLEEQGYEPEAQVTQKGELALRGGILDVYPLTSPWPVRLEFFGDELESLRYFDPLTQISREEIVSVTLPPAGELGLLKSKARNVECGIGEVQSVHSPQSTVHSSPAKVEKSVGDSAGLGTLLDYLPPGTLVLLCEPEQLEQRAEEYAAQALRGDPFLIRWDEFQQQALSRRMTFLGLTESESAGDPTPHAPLLAAAETEDPSPEAAALTPNIIPHSALPTPYFESLDAFRPLAERAPEPPVAEAQRREFFAQLHRWLRQGYAVHVFCNNEGERQRFGEIWKEYGLETPNTKHHTPGPEVRDQKSEVRGQKSEVRNTEQEPRTTDHGPQTTNDEPRTTDYGLQTHLGSLSRGFLYDEAKLVVVTDAEIFGRYKVQRPRRLKSPHALATRSALDIDFTDLEDGDYVVHLQHGIGRYLGLQVLPIGAGTKPTEGATAKASPGQECLVIEYAPNDPAQPPPKLYVPVTEAHLVSKYVGTGKARPPLNTLGGTRWAKAKAQAERAVRDVASDLLSIQAARDTQPGHAFAPDAPWQREFEGAFLFEETPDQMRAIVETKGDMERPKPMDRLICGDVGFGKTEVGIRAAFKAVMDGKQVAVLVPTTVLAQQHFNTFRERMADYPVRIELLSRFRTRRAQQRVVKDLAAGSVDIVIGTHRLLQNDIAFKDLGLVVIDEEQRFGVMHKEKFKMLRQLVDVLTLSATPIPRTLYLALTGARDMSTIQTPPHDRLPVETIVAQYDERVIRDAIQRELNRGGQVFFLHNRVMTIETMAQKLRTLLPHARIVVGHGQMHSDDLEEVMTKFVNGEADILLSTTIIESGLDIPNANTIIIDRADRFGLSDLYQLRGRVGRYKHQAYAYLLLPRHAGLLADVRKRLSAIKQYSTLGSGFKIAMRDLEIRGAGNLLGAEQSGHITAVGFELYCQLLKQSVASLKGEKVKPRVHVQVRLDFLAMSPGDERPQPTRHRPQAREGASRGAEVGSQRPEVGIDEMQDVPQLGEEERNTQGATRTAPPASAYIPFNYISDSRQRIEIYRKLAQATEQESVRSLEKELRDRFGLVPAPLGLLLQVAQMKVLAAERGITTIEVKEDRLMLTRANDFIMVGSKFPRLTKTEPGARLKEIQKLLRAL
jgi:transcription-repair coupling factor (superfamily II helicase)